MSRGLKLGIFDDQPEKMRQKQVYNYSCTCSDALVSVAKNKRKHGDVPSEMS